MLTAKYLTKARKRKKISQSDLAEMMGYGNGQYVSNWERGLCHPPTNKISKLATILGVPPSKVAKLMAEDKFKEYQDKFQTSSQRAA